MDAARKEIEALIPHRRPFLFVDRIISCDKTTITTEKTFAADLAFYAGHYPDNPVTPGVILSEAIFQSGALLIARTAEKKEIATGVPVLTRITGAKYKRSVFPGEQIVITVSLKEKVANVWFLKGVIKKEGKTAVQIEFACTLAAKS
ncbi:MAG: beta-hydroxyacyl-ACP dehydratase [Desulfobacterales bacterium]|nr:MAG: beta-hydroxyacyl-ACP dehydratase [Desulfobacterales bacterium]